MVRYEDLGSVDLNLGAERAPTPPPTEGRGVAQAAAFAGKFGSTEVR
jgi:hypothetical protein